MIKIDLGVARKPAIHSMEEVLAKGYSSGDLFIDHAGDIQLLVVDDSTDECMFVWLSKSGSATANCINWPLIPAEKCVSVLITA